MISRRDFRRYVSAGLFLIVAWFCWISPAQAQSPGDQITVIQAPKDSADVDKFNPADKTPGCSPPRPWC
ncbi:MAG: hypothetical protein ABSA26_14720 [Thermoguttaceae bacterium]|jgi:hypothetical protein